MKMVRRFADAIIQLSHFGVVRLISPMDIRPFWAVLEANSWRVIIDESFISVVPGIGMKYAIME